MKKILCLTTQWVVALAALLQKKQIVNSLALKKTSNIMMSLFVECQSI